MNIFDPAGRRCLCAILSCFAGVSLAGPAASAVRLCKAHVTSKLVSAISERDGKRAAIADWTAKAVVAGIAHPSWRIANYKVVKCVPRGGLYECIAHAAPCTIKQKVPKSKPGLRQQPGAAAAEI